MEDIKPGMVIYLTDAPLTGKAKVRKVRTYRGRTEAKLDWITIPSQWRNQCKVARKKDPNDPYWDLSVFETRLLPCSDTD